MKLRTVIEQPSFTLTLDRELTVTIYDDGRISVRQPERDLLNGAPSGPDVPRYAPGGRYEFTLPDVMDIADACDQRDADPEGDFPASGNAIITVTHCH